MDEPETPNPDDPRTFVRALRPPEDSEPDPMSPMPPAMIPTPPMAWTVLVDHRVVLGAGLGVFLLGMFVGWAVGSRGCGPRQCAGPEDAGEDRP